MASSMLTGDRRWAPTRKLTVLGKVPKPINLPSQRLENHGLDPNVEIVPKGTLTWGSRPSTTVPNAWGTSSTSPPHIDGHAGSPSHRPSSGGGTRPSTAGSDRSHEPVSNAWGPNSRPSSASGVLASSQIVAAGTRPRSADTRPGSSQLSRFADNSVDSTGAWGTAGTAERLGTPSSKSGGFTLSSGDFPSLGSDKNSDTHSQRGHSSQGRPQSSQGRPQSSQGRPASACGADSKPKDFLEPHGNRNSDHFEHGTVNTWKADNFPQTGYGASPNMDNWHRDAHQAYQNMNMPPPHYDSWHNPTFHPNNGAWYRGGPPGGPYRPPAPPGGYPIDYPHAPPRPLSNPQFPGQDVGPGGFYPNNCEPYRPYMPSERYMGPSRPDVPVRHGAYPGPVPCEGYYGPPGPSFYSSTERDASVIGMVRPVVNNQYSAQHQNYDPMNFHGRPCGYASMNKEHREPDQVHGNQGPYRVLLKQHEGSEENNEAEKPKHTISDGMTHIDKGKPSGISSQKGDWETKHQVQETIVSHRLSGEAVSSRPTNSMDESRDPVVSNSLVGSFEVADDGLTKRPEAVNVQSCGPQQYPVIKKNASLMEKVESLNNKARLADCQSEGGPITSREKRTGFKDVITGADRFTKVGGPNASVGDNTASTLNVASVIPKELNASVEDKSQETDTAGKVDALNSAHASGNALFVGQKKFHVMKNIDDHAKSRSNRHGNDERMKKPTGSEPSASITGTDIKGRILETNASHEAFEQQEPFHAVSGRDALRTSPSVDPVDHKTQRAKMIERAKQLQQEEEERTREQKAKALAKLEELNRRTLAESSNLKSGYDSSQGTDALSDKQEPGPPANPSTDTTSKETSVDTLAFDSGRVKWVDDCGVKQSTDLSFIGAAAPQPLHSSTQTSEVSEVQFLLPMEQESNLSTKNVPESSSDIHSNTIPKQKQVGYRKKHINLQETSTGGKQMNSTSTRSPKVTGEVVVNSPGRDVLPNIEDPSSHKRKNNKSARNNGTSKLGEDLTSSTSPSPPPTAEASKTSQTESGMTNPSGTVIETVSVPCGNSNENEGTASSREKPDMPLNQGSESTEDASGRASNYGKSHSQRKTTRNQQPGKPGSKYHATEAVMWAPVKPPSKNGATDEVGRDSTTEPTKPPARSGSDPQNSMKAKRAEIERYVPKPVAKELLQQVNSQQASPSLSQAALGYVTGKSETCSPSTLSGGVDGPIDGKAASATGSDAKHGDNLKYNKNGRANASWRQRVSSESPSVEGVGLSHEAKPVHKVSDQLPTSNLDNVPQGQSTHTDDGWNDVSYNVQPSELVTSSVSKSYGASRQKRQPYKVHRVTGSNHPASDSMDLQEGIINTNKQQSPASGHIEPEGRNTIRNESQSGGSESTKSHWQPKSQASNHGRLGNRGNRAQRVSSDGREDASPINEDANTSSQRTTVVEARDARHQESRRDRKVISDPARVHTTYELAPDTGHQRGQAFRSGGDQRGQDYGCIQRGYDPNYRGPDSGKETNRQSYGDRRRSNQNVEYQQIRSYDKAGDTYRQNPTAVEGAHEPSRAAGSRYRGRGRNFPRGGNRGQFYGQGAAAAAADQVGDSYTGGE